MFQFPPRTSHGPPPPYFFTILNVSPTWWCVALLVLFKPPSVLPQSPVFTSPIGPRRHASFVLCGANRFAHFLPAPVFCVLFFSFTIPFYAVRCPRLALHRPTLCSCSYFRPGFRFGAPSVSTLFFERPSLFSRPFAEAIYQVFRVDLVSIVTPTPMNPPLSFLLRL